MIPAPRVLQLTGEENGCLLWRTLGPCRELQSRGYTAHHAPLHGCPMCGWSLNVGRGQALTGRMMCPRCHYTFHPDDAGLMTLELVAAGMYDALILPRLSWETGSAYFKAKRWIGKLHDAGLAVIYEQDDDVFTPQIAARQQATTERDRTLDQLEQDRRDRIVALRMCDGVTVSNDNLARVVSTYTNAPVRVVPNSIDLHWFKHHMHGVRRRVAPLTIGWAGGARGPEDLDHVAEAWRRIARRYPQVTFVVFGSPLVTVVTEGLPEDRVVRLPWVDLASYPGLLKNIDIGCASVADTAFNRCKSPIKVWEYTAAGAVSVVSPTLYGPVVRDGQDALVAETADEWEAALSRLVEDAVLRRRLKRAQRKVMAEQHSLEVNWHRWLEAWHELIVAHRSRPRLLLAV